MLNIPSPGSVFVNRLFDAFEKNLLVSSSIAAAMVITACIMWSSGVDIPKPLETCLMLVLGYFLGSKAERASRTRSERRK